MSEETNRTYKYVILRDRNGNYLVPYSGVAGLQDVAFTGSYKDLKDTPVDGEFLPAGKITTDSGDLYSVRYAVEFEDDISLKDIEPDLDGCSGEGFAITDNFVWTVVNTIEAGLKEGLKLKEDYSIDEDAIPHHGSSDDGESSDDEIHTNYKGSVTTFADLPRTGMAVYDVYYVDDESRWYMYIIGDNEVGIWVHTYEGDEITPS